MNKALCIVSGLLVSAALAGCDNSSSNKPAAPPTTKENPTSIYGKAAKMGRDAAAGVEQAGEQANQAANALAGGAFTEIAGLQWPIPEGWQKQPPTSPMRIAEYTMPGGISVRFFAVGGGVEDNMRRWRGQVTNQIAAERTRTFNAGNLKIHTIVLNGTYAAMGPTGAPSAPAENTGFLGAIVEGGPSPVQLVMTGPWPAVEAAEKAWNTMLAGIQQK